MTGAGGAMLVLAVACAGVPDENDASVGSDGSGGGGGSGGGNTGLVTIPRCHAIGFEQEAASWSLPILPANDDGSMLLTAAEGTGSCPTSEGGGTRQFSNFDITGDQKSDLVLTSGCGNDSDTGKTHWLVYANTGDGFAAGPIEWTLPGDPDSTKTAEKRLSFSATSGSGTCPNGAAKSYTFATLDLTGDQKPDLVFSEACDDPQSIDSSEWTVYVNNGKGFDKTPIAWSVPHTPGAGKDRTRLLKLTGSKSCATPGGGALRHSVIDVTGDGAPDLVFTEACKADESTGVTRWLVYENLRNGFDDTAMEWALPKLPETAAGGSPLTRLSTSTSCATSGGSSIVALSVNTVDINGDHKPDLVVTQACDTDIEAGRSHWLVYQNHGSGFDDQPQKWALPQLAANSAEPVFTKLAGTSACPVFEEGGPYIYRMVDLTNDGAPDLVISQACGDDEATGKTRWLVYPNTGQAFEATPQSWPLPSMPEATPPDTALTKMSATSSCSGSTSSKGSSLRFHTFDVTGDVAPDLVFTADCGDDLATGRSRWLVYNAICIE